MLDYLCVFSSIISFSVNVISQVCIFRYLSRLRLLKSVLIAFALGGCILAFIESYYITQSSFSLVGASPSMLTNIIIYSSLGYCYFHFINLGETARRIRILRELYDSKGGLSMEEILAHYSTKEMIERRIERLLSNGQINIKNEKYYIKSLIMLFIAKIIIAMKMGLLNKTSELD